MSGSDSNAPLNPFRAKRGHPYDGSKKREALPTAVPDNAAVSLNTENPGFCGRGFLSVQRRGTGGGPGTAHSVPPTREVDCRSKSPNKTAGRICPHSRPAAVRRLARAARAADG